MRRLAWCIPVLLLGSPLSAVADGCQFAPLPAPAGAMGKWIDRKNWLAPEHRRPAFLNASVFMPARQLSASGNPIAEAPEAVESILVTDPADGSQRDVAFLLDARLEADGFIVLRNGRIVSERYRNGLRRELPRWAPDAARPLLNVLGAIAIGQGKLSADRAVARGIPPLAASVGLRKLSVQRLLENRDGYRWSNAERDEWRAAAGWTGARPARAGVRGWMEGQGLWDRALEDELSAIGSDSPEDDLMAWLLSEAFAAPVSETFCQQFLARRQPAYPLVWLTDGAGTDLAHGLALSLRDFAQIGQLLVEARGGRNRTRIPNWFIETLAASAGVRSREIKGFSQPVDFRYGFLRLGGEGTRIAIVGGLGTSLYMDFNRRVVVAVFSSNPEAGSALSLASLEQIWKAASRGKEDRTGMRTKK